MEEGINRTTTPEQPTDDQEEGSDSGEYTNEEEERDQRPKLKVTYTATKEVIKDTKPLQTKYPETEGVMKDITVPKTRTKTGEASSQKKENPKTKTIIVKPQLASTLKYKLRSKLGSNSTDKTKRK